MYMYVNKVYQNFQFSNTDMHVNKQYKCTVESLLVGPTKQLTRLHPHNIHNCNTPTTGKLCIKMPVIQSTPL